MAVVIQMVDNSKKLPTWKYCRTRGKRNLKDAILKFDVD